MSVSSINVSKIVSTTTAKVVSKTTLLGSLYQLKPSITRYKYKPAEYDDEVLNPYPEGEWATLVPREDYLKQMFEEDPEQETQSGVSKVDDDEEEEEEEDGGSNEEEEDEFEELKVKKVLIHRGPIWNYGLRKMSNDAEYYNYILFGVPWSSMLTPEEKILKGMTWAPEKPINRSLARFLMRKLRKMNPENTALLEMETGRSVTYEELASKAEQVACGLHHMGVQEKQILAIVSYHSIEAHIMVLACLLIGVVAALVDSSLSPVEMGIVLRNTSPNLMFSEPGKTLHKVEAAISYLDMSLHNPKPLLIINSVIMQPSTRYMLFNQLLKEVDPDKPTPGPHKADPLRPILILYTCQNNMDDLKPCLIAERYFTHSMPFVDTVMPATDEPNITIMCTPPMSSALAIKGVLNHYVDGHRIVLVRGPISEPCLITALRKYEVFAILTVRTVLMALLDWPAKPRCPQLKMIAVTGVPLRLKYFHRVNELFKKQVRILQLYGLVETGTAAQNTFLVNKHGSVGKLFYNTEVKVLEEGTGIPLGPNEEGELCVRSATMMLGYYNNPEANKEMIDSEGFVHTGDLGYYDEEGFLFVTDQVNEMIHYKNYLVSPSLVVEVLTELPEIKEAFVFGLFDEEDGELVSAAIILETGYEDTDISALEKHANSLLPSHRKIRGGIYVFEQFPRSSIGKPLKETVIKEVIDRQRRSRRRTKKHSSVTPSRKYSSNVA